MAGILRSSHRAGSEGMSRNQVLLRLVRGPGRAWLAQRGLTYLQLPVPDET
jgi:hypothetical protein